MYTTTITDNVEDIEAEAHVLDVGKILKQNLEECEYRDEKRVRTKEKLE